MQMKIIKHIVSVLLLILFFSSLAAQPVSVLFVGNSLTYRNNLPFMIKQLARQFKVKLRTASVAYPNYGLEDHVNDGRVSRMLQQRPYDFMVIQQGPSSQEYGRRSLIEYGGILCQLAKDNDTQPAYFMVWPSIPYYHTFSGVILNYTNAAIINEAVSIPVGKVWRAYRESNKESSLYDLDGFHPSKTGTFLAAIVILKKLVPEIDLDELSFKSVEAFIKEEAEWIYLKKIITEN